LLVQMQIIIEKYPCNKTSHSVAAMWMRRKEKFQWVLFFTFCKYPTLLFCVLTLFQLGRDNFYHRNSTSHDTA
jgi:hypothetical protein